MISNYKKQEFINEINVLLHGMELARINGEQIDKNIEEAKKLKEEIESENDITLEETMEIASKDANLEIESDIELNIRMKIEKIKAGVPSRFFKMAKIREQQESFEFLPLKEKTQITEICEAVVNDNPELLKFVPISVIETNPDLWDKYFVEQGIDINLFMEYDTKIRENISHNILVKESTAEQPIKTTKEGYIPPKEKKYKILTEEDAQKYKKMVEEDAWMIGRMPIEFLKENKEWCMKVCEKDIEGFRNLPEQFKLENPEWTMTFEEELHYIPEKIKLENPKWCMRIGEKESHHLLSVPEQTKLSNPKWCMELVEKFKRNYYIPNSIILLNKSQYMEIVEKYPVYFEYEIPVQIALANIDWYKSICKKAKEQREYKFDETKFEENFKKRILELENQYINNFYGSELNIEALKESYALVLDKEHIIEIQQKRVPVMKDTYQGIAKMEDGMQDEYLKRANELANQYIQLMKDKANVKAEEMTRLISSISMLEMEIGTKNNKFKERKAAEEAYKQTKDDITRKIAQIKGINPELAKQYTEELQANEGVNISYRAKTGMVSPEEIKISNEVDFFVNANFRKENQKIQSDKSEITDMTVYKEPTKKGFWARLIDKIRGKSSERELHNEQNGKESTHFRELIKAQDVDTNELGTISETPKKERMREDSDEQQQ